MQPSLVFLIGDWWVKLQRCFLEFSPCKIGEKNHPFWRSNIFQMGASTTNQFLIKLSCAHSLEAICIAGPADNSAVLEGEAIGFLFCLCVQINQQPKQRLKQTLLHMSTWL